MSDIDVAVRLIKSGRLSTDQIMQYALNGLLRPLPGEGVQVTFMGDVAPYRGDEVAWLHPAIAMELGRRGLCFYAV